MAEALKHYRLAQTRDVVVTRHLAKGKVRRYVLQAGRVFRASATCDPEGGVANLEHDPPLLRTSIIAAHPNTFILLD